jgi:hypothetical protein
MKQKVETNGPGVAPSLAAQFLATQLGESVDLWLYRLANWRRPGRSAPLRVTQSEAGHPSYTATALEKFVADELSRRILVSGGSIGEQPRAGATPKIDGPDKPHVRVLFAIGAVSQSVFAIDHAAARKLADMLNKSASIVEKATI